MINLLQSNVCGRATRSAPNNNNDNNNNNDTNASKKSSFLSQNLQQNGNLNSEKFDETMKIDEISSGDQIAFIKIQDDLSSPSPIKAAKQFQRQTQFQKFFMKFYPDFVGQYCLCMHRKVQPDDLITVHNYHHHHTSDDHYSDKYAANSFLLSHTSIIPITVVPQKYEYPMKSPNLDERMLHTEELNRRNMQQSEFENISVEDGDVNNRSQNYITPIKSATSQSLQSNFKQADTNANEQASHIDSDDDDVSIGISLGKNSPVSHASAVTTRSIHDINSPDFDSRSKSARSIGQSSIDEIHTVKSNAVPPSTENGNDHGNGDSGDTIDTSLEHIQNENNEKLMAEESKDETSDETVQMVEDSDTVDSVEKTAEIHIETQPEQLLDSAYMSIHKPTEVDDNEPHSESDTVSITSTEGSSDYLTRRDGSIRSIEPSKISHKPIPKMRTAIPTRQNRITPAPKTPSTAIHKSQSTDMFPLALRKFDKPREAIVASHTCLNQLDSPTWEVTMNGLTTFVRLIRHHPEIVEAHLHAYCVALARQVKNLRSQVSRSACQASAEFFQTHAKHLETECDDLATQLLNRTADTNKFLRADAFRALAAMCDNLTPTKVIHAILTRGATHQNAIVRTAAANLCSRIVSRLGCEKFYAMNRDYRDKLVVAGANFLMEGSLDTRNHAKAFFKQISAHPQYNRMLQDVIPSRIYRNIEKALRSIK